MAKNNDIVNQSVCVFGEKNICEKMTDDNAKKMISYFNKIISNFIKKGVKYFISNGEVGTSLLFAYAVQQAKKGSPDIKNLIAVPFEKQSESYTAEEKNFYTFTLKNADNICYVDKLPNYSDGKSKEGEPDNNKFKQCLKLMIDNSLYVVSVFSKKDENIASGLSYANKLKKKIIVLNPEDNYKAAYYNFK